jgi:hypothetical protein
VTKYLSSPVSGVSVPGGRENMGKQGNSHHGGNKAERKRTENRERKRERERERERERGRERE